MWNKQRLELKQTLVDFASTFYDTFNLSDLDLEMTASDHYPSLWNFRCVDRQLVFFSRGKESRKVVEEVIDINRSLKTTIQDPTPYFKHLFIGVEVNFVSISIAVCLNWKAWVDRENFLTRLQNEQERLKFLDIMRSLPEEYMVKIDDVLEINVKNLSEENLNTLIEKYRLSEGFWKMGLFIHKDNAIALGEDLWEVLRVAFMLLLPVYEFCAWNRSNDFISMSEKQKAAEEKKLIIAQQHVLEEEAFKSEKEKERLERIQRFNVLKEEIRSSAEIGLHGDFSGESLLRSSSRVRVKHPLPSKWEKPQNEVKKAQNAVSNLHKIFREEKDKKEHIEETRKHSKEEREPDSFKFGDIVTITEGILKGRVGVVHEVDTKGNVKIILGSMVTRIPVSGIRHFKRRK